MTNMREHAVALAKRGFHVFPLVESLKIPQSKSWQERATSDPDKVYEMWSGVMGEPTLHNIGVSTSGLLVVDADIKDGRQGIEICELLGLELDTFVVQSPSGGRHYYYKTDTPVGNSVQKLGDGVDIRGEGGYVVGPGSFLDGSLIDNKGTGGAYVVIADHDTKKAPAFIQQAAGQRRGRKVSDTGEILEESLLDISSARSWLESHAPAIEGDGGDLHTFQTAAYLRQLGITKETAFGLMLDYWNDRCEPPWEFDDLKTKVDNAFKFASGQPGELSLAAAVDGLASIKPPQLHDKNWFFAGDPLDTDEAWLFHEMLPAYGVGFLSGPSYSGKSFLMLDIARALSTKSEFFGTNPDEDGGTIIIAGEGKSGMRRRLAALQTEAKDLAIAGRSAGGLYDEEAFIEMMQDVEFKMKAMREHFKKPVRLLVFDTLSSTGLVEDENDNSQVAQALAKLNHMSEKLSVLVMITHHPAANGKSERGATAIFNNSDFMLRIEREDPQAPVRTLVLAKLKEGNAPRDIGWFELPTYSLGIDSRGREIKSCYVQSVSEPEKTEKIPKAYDNWLGNVSYLASITNHETDLGQKLINPQALMETSMSDGMSRAAHTECLAHAIKIGVISKEAHDGKQWLVYKG